jgi:hypothetical protein
VAKQRELQRKWEELKEAMRVASDSHEEYEDAVATTKKVQSYINDQWNRIRGMPWEQLKKETSFSVHWLDTPIDEDEWFPLEMLTSSECMKSGMMEDFKPVLRFSWDSGPAHEDDDDSCAQPHFAPKLLTCPHNDAFCGSVEFHNCTWRPSVVVVTTRAGMDRSTSKDTQRLEQILNSTKIPFATVSVDSRSDPDATHWKKMLKGNIGNITYPQLVAFGNCIGDIDAVQELVDSNKKTWLEDLRPPKAPLIGKEGYDEQAQKLKDRDEKIRSLERKLEITKEDLKQKQASGNVEKLRLELVAKDKEIEKLKRDLETHQRELEVSKKELSLSLSQIKVFHVRHLSSAYGNSRCLPSFVFVRSYLALFSHFHASFLFML